jgi:hypothetical protein
MWMTPMPNRTPALDLHMTARGDPLTLPALGVFDGILSDLGEAFRLQAPPAHLLLLPESRAVTILLAAPLLRYGSLAPLSFFLKAELCADGEMVVQTAEKAKEPKLNLAVIGVYAFNSTFFEVYPKLKPIWRNEKEILDAISLLISEGFKVILDMMESVKRDVKDVRIIAVSGSGRRFKTSCPVECVRPSDDELVR